MGANLIINFNSGTENQNHAHLYSKATSSANRYPASFGNAVLDTIVLDSTAIEDNIHDHPIVGSTLLGGVTGTVGLVTGGFDGNVSSSILPKYLTCKYIYRIY